MLHNPLDACATRKMRRKIVKRLNEIGYPLDHAHCQLCYEWLTSGGVLFVNQTSGKAFVLVIRPK